MAALVAISNQMLEQSAFDIEGEIRSTLSCSNIGAKALNVA